jgi:hypothetical protein
MEHPLPGALPWPGKSSWQIAEMATAASTIADGKAAELGDGSTVLGIDAMFGYCSQQSVL